MGVWRLDRGLDALPICPIPNRARSGMDGGVACVLRAMWTARQKLKPDFVRCLIGSVFATHDFATGRTDIIGERIIFFAYETASVGKGKRREKC